MADDAPLGTNERFSEAVTSQAFALTLSRAMIQALADTVEAADKGDVYLSNEQGWRGLERRGLVYWGKAHGGDENKPRFGLMPTRAGRLTLELCRCAGLQPGDPGDDVLAAIRAGHAAQAEREREVDAEQARKHAEWRANLVTLKGPLK